MLNALMYGNDDHQHKDGQPPILHLEASLATVIKWCEENSFRWAIALGNAAKETTEFRSFKESFAEINWNAVKATDFRSPEIKESKQAEFLVEDSLPWELIETIGVYGSEQFKEVSNLIASSEHKPNLLEKRNWYFPAKN